MHKNDEIENSTQVGNTHQKVKKMIATSKREKLQKFRVTDPTKTKSLGDRWREKKIIIKKYETKIKSRELCQSRPPDGSGDIESGER